MSGLPWEPGSLLTIEEAALTLRCSTKHIRRQVKAGRLRAYRAIGGRLLFDSNDLKGLLSVVGSISSPAELPNQSASPPLTADPIDAWIRGLGASAPHQN